MSEKKTTNNTGGLATGIALATAILPLVKPAIDTVTDYAGKAIEERKKLIAVPELYLKGYPLTAEQAIEVLNSCGLKATIIETPLSDANPKLRNCFDGQVVGSEPKAKHKVEPGRTISVKCITQKVIEESQRLYEESEIRKAEAKARRDERIEQSKTALVGVTEKIKEIPKRNKNNVELIEMEEGESHEQTSSQEA